MCNVWKSWLLWNRTWEVKRKYNLKGYDELGPSIEPVHSPVEPPWNSRYSHVSFQHIFQKNKKILPHFRTVAAAVQIVLLSPHLSTVHTESFTLITFLCELYNASLNNTPKSS